MSETGTRAPRYEIGETKRGPACRQAPLRCRWGSSSQSARVPQGPGVTGSLLRECNRHPKWGLDEGNLGKSNLPVVRTVEGRLRSVEGKKALTATQMVGGRRRIHTEEPWGLRESSAKKGTRRRYVLAHVRHHFRCEGRHPLIWGRGLFGRYKEGPSLFMIMVVQTKLPTPKPDSVQ